MGKKKRKKTQRKIYTLLIGIVVILCGILTSEWSGTFGFTEPVFSSFDVHTDLKVYYLDVGQADAILIQNQDESMLIDAGNNEDGELLVEYFEKLGITDFKYVVGTHPHEDHIGGLDDIIYHFPIETLYLPDAITTSATFVSVLDSLEEKNMTYTVPKIGEEFSLGEARIKVIYTGDDTSDLNNASIVFKLIFGQTSFLFTGDATEVTEKKILDSDISVDILKVGHHGSKYSTSKEFLEKVNPKYAIISVGLHNSYDHPGEITIQKLMDRNIEIHRTDQEGTILVTSDGTNLNFSNFKTNTNGG